MEVLSMLSEKGNRLLVVNGFKFCVGRIVRDGTVTWRCTNKKTKCKAKAVTKGIESTTLIESELCHNHIQEGNLHRQMFNNSVKKKAVDDTFKKPSKLIHEELRRCPEFSDHLTTRDVDLVR